MLTPFGSSISSGADGAEIVVRWTGSYGLALPGPSFLIPVMGGWAMLILLASMRHSIPPQRTRDTLAFSPASHRIVELSVVMRVKVSLQRREELVVLLGSLL